MFTKKFSDQGQWLCSKFSSVFIRFYALCSALYYGVLDSAIFIWNLEQLFDPYTCFSYFRER